MVHHFSQSSVIVGLFASLLRGGAIAVQLYAAYHAQSYRRVMPYIRRVFFARFASWFAIGAAIYLIGDSHPSLTLFFIGAGLFLFSFSAGFGAIYFKELQAKLFSRTYRGRTMANRQVAGSIASIISGGVAGYILSRYEAPLNYACLFMVSSFLMGIGFLIFGTIEEPEKARIQEKEGHFGAFVRNAAALLGSDRRLRDQIVVLLLANGYLLAMPFVILKANTTFTLTGWMLGGFITLQMVGSILGSTFLWRRISDYERMLSLAILTMLLAYGVALFASDLYGYALLFLLFGIGLDGISISGMNLVIEIAPEEKRPVYTALQSNITSLGLFFPILGGILLKYSDSYLLLYLLTLALLATALRLSRRLHHQAKEHT